LLISFKTSLLWRKSAALLGFGFKTEKSEINLSCQISELRCIRKLAANKRCRDFSSSNRLLKENCPNYF
jgi:hypothetical protein